MARCSMSIVAWMDVGCNANSAVCGCSMSNTNFSLFLFFIFLFFFFVNYTTSRWEKKNKMRYFWHIIFFDNFWQFFFCNIFDMFDICTLFLCVKKKCVHLRKCTVCIYVWVPETSQFLFVWFLMPPKKLKQTFNDFLFFCFFVYFFACVLCTICVLRKKNDNIIIPRNMQLAFCLKTLIFE